MKDPEPPPGYVTSRELYELDKKLRKRYGLQPRANRNAFRWALCYKKIRHTNCICNCKRAFWDVEHYYTVFAKMYENHGNFCSRTTRQSCEKSHLTATPAILADPNYLPLAQAAQAGGFNPYRIGIWVRYMTIIPYYDPDKKRLLYPVKECRELAQYRTFSFIWKHLGEEKAKEIRSTRKAKHWNYGSGICSMYYAPELSHL